MALPTDLLAKLQDAEGSVTPKLSPDAAKSAKIERIEVTEKVFRWLLNEEAMATDKLAEGIRNFAAWESRRSQGGERATRFAQATLSACQLPKLFT